MRPTISGIQPRRRRGCLSGCFTQVVAALTLGVLVVLAVYGLIAYLDIPLVYLSARLLPDQFHRHLIMR